MLATPGRPGCSSCPPASNWPCFLLAVDTPGPVAPCSHAAPVDDVEDEEEDGEDAEEGHVSAGESLPQPW